MRLPVVVAAFGLLTGSAWAQDYAFRQYGVEAGLPVAYTLTFDGAGRLLVGTNDGLARFDGQSFVDVPLPVEGVVWRLVTAPDGTVWGLTNQAALFHLTSVATAEAVPVPPALRVRLGEQVWPIRIHTDTRGRLWLSGGDGALYRWDGPARPTWTVFRVPGTDFIGDFFVRGDGDDGDLVVAARNRIGVLPLREGRLGPPRWLPPFEQRVFYVRPHPTALAWAGGDGGVYLIANDGHARRVTADGERAWPHNEPGVDAAGRLLTLGEGPKGGILRFAPDGTLELAAGAEEGLEDGLPVRFAFDPEGGFWFAHRRGVTVLDDEHTRIYPLEGGEQAFVNGMVGDPAKGVLWVSTYGGMYWLDGHRLVHVRTPGPMTLSPIAGADGGASWIEPAGRGEPLDWRGRSSRGNPPGRPPILVYEGQGSRYETDASGLWRVRDGRRVRLGPDFVPGATGSEDPDGRLWLGGEPGRLDVIWGDSLASACAACLPPSLRTALDTLNALLRVDVVTADAYGHVWVSGATGGLGVLWPEPGSRWAWRLLGEREGLLAQLLHSVTVSPDGHRLWLGTSRGLQGLRLGPGPPRLDPFAELRARDGLEGEVVIAALEDRDGFLWANLVPGKIHRLDWRALADSPPSPPVHIEQVEVNGQPVAVGTGRVRLRAGDGLSVGLWPQTYRQPLRVRLEYRLGGRDAPWTPLGAARRLALAALPSGQHTLEARAVREGQPPGPVVRLALAVAPPFWRSAWFAALVALALGGAAFGVHRVRAGRRRAVEALRFRIATDLHDEVGSGLTQVSLYSELIRRTAEGTAGGNGRAEDADARVVAWAARVGDQASTLSGAMRDVIWAIRPDENAWESLELRMKDAAVALLAPHDIEVDMAGEVEGAPPLSPEVRQNVLLFFKEAVHNAARHAAPTRVEVRWRLTRRALSLRIADDGRGFNPAAARRGTGLLSLRRRADALGGTFALTTTPGVGTALQLDIPLERRWPWQRKPHASERAI